MPPRPPLADTWRVSIHSHSTSEAPQREAANIHYFQFTPAETPDATELSALADQFLGFWGNRFKLFMHNSAEYDTCTLTAVDGTETQGVSTAAAIPGTGADSRLQASLSACISWKIGAAYRGGHPRSYLSFLDSGIVSAADPVNLLDPAVAANLAVHADGYLTDVNTIMLSGSIAQAGTVSYFRGNVLRPVPVFFPYLTGSRVNTRFASQRRRLGKLTVGTYEV